MRIYGNVGSTVAGHHSVKDDDEFAGLRTKPWGHSVAEHAQEAAKTRPTPTPQPLPAARQEPPPPPAPTPAPAAAAPAKSRGSGAARLAQRLRDAGTTARDVRAWAAAVGINCPAAGPLPGHVIDAYLTHDHGTPAPPPAATPPPVADGISIHLTAKHAAQVVDALLALADVIGDALDASGAR